jgi:2'-hydroxyisoflavone reductase
MKLLILGGTVFLGKNVAEAGVARGHEVTIFNRGLHDSESDTRIERLRGDRRDDLSALVGRNWDAVIDTSGYVPSAVRASAELLADTVPHYTFISSQSVYANFDRPNFNEDHPVQELTDEQVKQAEAMKPDKDGVVAISYGELYGGLKARCERAAEEAMPGRVLNIRAGLIVGPNDYIDRFTYWVRRMARGGEVLAPGLASRPVQLVDVRDLAEWLVTMAELKVTGVFNATGPENKLSMGELLDGCAVAGESDSRLTWVSEEFLARHKVQPWSEMPLWMPAEVDVDNFFSADCSKAIDAGLKFRSIEDTARATLEWDRTRDQSVALRAGISAERERELLAAWHGGQRLAETAG